MSDVYMFSFFDLLALKIIYGFKKRALPAMF